MAIYHLEAKVVSRGAGRSACAASAYLSCSHILNDYDGVQHDYTRKQGLVWQEVFLPDMAPPAWQDREVLWNAVEENEKTKDSRLAREFVVALPIELSLEQWQTLLTDFVQNQFVADGMCADLAIHDPDPPGHNPHAHILLTVRPLDESGKWQYKTEKEYLCSRDGEERGFTAAEFKAAQADGWEKQYQYKVGRKKVYMTPSAAEEHGYERASKYPKSTKYGRQNPISERWNSEEQLLIWRKAWADVTNKYLERYGHEERIDHRSFVERGIDEQPTIHEGVIARALEQKGIVSDRCELNRQIKADNRLLRELKAQFKKITEAVKNTLPAIAEALEKLRENMLIFCYQLGHIRSSKKQMTGALNILKPNLAQYRSLVQQIKETTKERKSLLAEKKSLPAIHFVRHRELASKIAELTEKLEELKSEKAMLLHSLEYPEDATSDIFQRQIFLDGHVGCGALERVLEQMPDDLAALVLRRKGDVLSAQQNAALVGDKAAGDGVEQGGFARAIGAHDGGKISGLHLQAYAVQCHLFVDGAGVKGLVQVVQLQHFHVTVPPCWSRCGGHGRRADAFQRRSAPGWRAWRWPLPR